MPRTKVSKIKGLTRKPKRTGGYFDDLLPDQRRHADYYPRFVKRWRRRGCLSVLGDCWKRMERS